MIIIPPARRNVNKTKKENPMKKISLLATVILGLTLFPAAGCANDRRFLPKSYSSEQTDIRSVTVDVRDREIEVTASADGRVHIDYHESEKEFYRIEETGGDLSVTAQTDKDWTDFIGTKPPAEYRKISLRIPALSSLCISTTNEEIRISITDEMGSVALNANGGNLSFEKLNVKTALTLAVKNGNIEGTIVGDYDLFDITCEIKKGECNLPARKEGGEKSLGVSANNRDVRIEFAAG